jgi:hypothetical protein
VIAAWVDVAKESKRRAVANVKLKARQVGFENMAAGRVFWLEEEFIL